MFQTQVINTTIYKIDSDPNAAYLRGISCSNVIARNEALILPGAKLNALCATRRVNYKDVIYNLWQVGHQTLIDSRATARNDGNFCLSKRH